MKCPLCHLKNASFFTKSASYSYYTCNNCELIFIHRPKSSETLTKYYQKTFTYSLSRQNNTRLTNRAHKVIKNIRSLHPDSKSLLDIGAGQGHILQAAEERGYEVFGIEPSLSLYRQLTKEFDARIGNMDWDSFRKNHKGKFDVIILSHVIEHVIAPQKLVQEITLFLKPGGILFIETPNYDSHLAHYEKQNYTFLSPPQHLWILSAKSLAKITDFSLKNKKLDLVKTETYSYPEHFVGVIKSLIKQQDQTYQANDVNANIMISVPIHGLVAKVKIFLFDLIAARLLYRLMDINNKGSIIAIYLQKSA